MRRLHQEEKGWLRSNNIILDVRDTVIGRNDQGGPLKLSAYYLRLGSDLVGYDRAVERIQDAVRQLVEARKDSKAHNQIASRRESLSVAFADSEKWVSDKRLVVDRDKAAKSIDKAIIASIATRSIEQMRYGSL